MGLLTFRERAKRLAEYGAMMKTQELTVFDPAEGLTSDESIAAFMDEAFRPEDVGYSAHRLGIVARA